jgi:hypothetical protein
MSARRTADDDDQWVPFLEVYRGDPPGSRGQRAGVFPKPVVIVAAILLPVAVIGLVTYLLAMLLVGTVPFVASAGLVAISVGNVVGNVPDSEDFDRLLTRDLDSYFSDQCGMAVTVTYDLLRDVPSQAGTAYPKYYAWVQVFDGSQKIQSGVVRVGAMEKSAFYVTHYFSVDDIRCDPASVQHVFADDVYQKIQKRVSEEVDVIQ